MGRYYLHLRHADQSVVEDWEGSELSSLQAAREEAVRGMRSILAEAIKTGRDVELEAVVVTDDAGRQLDAVPVRAALPRSFLPLPR